MGIFKSNRLNAALDAAMDTEYSTDVLFRRFLSFSIRYGLINSSMRWPRPPHNRGFTKMRPYDIFETYNRSNKTTYAAGGLQAHHIEPNA